MDRTVRAVYIFNLKPTWREGVSINHIDNSLRDFVGIGDTVRSFYKKYHIAIRNYNDAQEINTKANNTRS